jgi:hypothetical protein
MLNHGEGKEATNEALLNERQKKDMSGKARNGLRSEMAVLLE